ncbi:hypothetical protein PQR02_22815 [Paraburkholderia sediminicola]|uniref:Uncharacterized protein n=1 Tax=Paraburkholderia rhynchosiae TaxID=487049 RepID=A0ACC7NAZ0_9BURK
MFSNKSGRFAAASLVVLCAAGLAHADEKHLTLDDIDGLARQNLVNSMRKADGSQPPAGGVALSAPILAAPAPPAATVNIVAKPPKRLETPVRKSSPVSFVGAYSDSSGAHVLYDYQGGVYSASRGEKLLNGWVVTRVDGYRVTVAEGRRTWSEVISQAAGVGSTGDGPAIQAITDLGAPLPMATNVGAFGGGR